MNGQDIFKYFVTTGKRLLKLNLVKIKHKNIFQQSAIFLIGVHPTLDWTATMRHELREKEAKKD